MTEKFAQAKAWAYRVDWLDKFEIALPYILLTVGTFSFIVVWW